MENRFVARKIRPQIEKMLTMFPVVTLTGVRQCGKSTLLKSFEGYEYVSLEEPDTREYAADDPRGFLSSYRGNVIIDEAQHVPSLFSYIQSIVDSENRMGRFILSGSSNFLLLEKVSQTLAGRCAVLHLSPFSIGELYAGRDDASDIDDFIFKGGYPAIYDRNIDPLVYYANYKDTYINRDVLMIKNIVSKYEFEKFLKLLAVNVSQVLNIASLARDCGVSVQTARDWLNILEAGFLIYFLPPFYKNISKRLVKSPKMYFVDTGLALSLMGITDKDMLMRSDKYGAVFENLAVNEFFKSASQAGKKGNFGFYRDSNGVEVDLIEENGDSLKLIDIKSSATFNTRYTGSFKKVLPVLQPLYRDVSTCVVYKGKDMDVGSTGFVNVSHAGLYVV